MNETRKLAAILAADVVGYSRLTGADEERTLARLRALRSDLIDPTVDVHRGRVVKRTGDGALVEFRSVVDAVRCALEIQTGMLERNAGVSEDRRIEFRIGIHLGDVVEESDGDLMGDGVNIAARLEGIASPGSVCLSEDAYRQVKSRLELLVSDLGETRLKNIADPVRVFSLSVGRDRPAPTSPAFAQERPDERLSIAVLPLANLSGEPEQGYFADGISDDIATALSALPQLIVIARNSSFAFKDKAAPIQEIGRILGARYVLEGSVRKAGDRVRITAQLGDATKGVQLWAERFDRKLDDIFAVQDDVTEKIVDALALNLTAHERRRLEADATDNMEAYESFLRGRDLFLRESASSNGPARDLLQRATEFDPDFAPAHAFLAAAHVLDYVNGWSVAPEKSLRLAWDAAQRAIALDPDYPHARFALAANLMWNRRLEEAITEAERCVANNPSFADGHAILGLLLQYSGRSAEGLRRIEHAMTLDPLHRHMILHFQALALFQLRRFDEAATVARKRIARNPETDSSRLVLASCYGHLGRAAEAQATWNELLTINPGFSVEQRRSVLPYRNPDDFELIVEGVKKAGINTEPQHTVHEL